MNDNPNDTNTMQSEAAVAAGEVLPTTSSVAKSVVQQAASTAVVAVTGGDTTSAVNNLSAGLLALEELVLQKAGPVASGLGTVGEPILGMANSEIASLLVALATDIKGIADKIGASISNEVASVATKV